MIDKIAYPVDVIEDGGAFIVALPDFPEVVTFDKNVEKALKRAIECLDTVLGLILKKGGKIPLPSLREGRVAISPSPEIEEQLLDFVIKIKD